MKVMLRAMGCACAFALILLPGSGAFAEDLDFDQPVFRTTWRQINTGYTLSFDRERKKLTVEFSGSYAKYNTSDAEYFRCGPGKGGADLCISTKDFDCAFRVTFASTSKVAHLTLRRSGRFDVLCRAMEGRYETDVVD
jgi:hypothetical protein